MDTIDKILKSTNKKNQNKIDWTKAWSEKYPILERYQKEVDTSSYAFAINEMLKQLQNEYGYSKQDAMLVLKDILYHEYKKR